MDIILSVAILLLNMFKIHCFNLDMNFPIVHIRPRESFPGRNSYFGFSVLLHQNWIQVGAPRANSTVLGKSVMEPGVVYKCKIFEICTEIVLDTNANEQRDDNMNVKDLKDHAWIGGAMAMGYEENAKVVVCGHRWKNQAPTESKYLYMYAMTGICYISQYEPDSFQYSLPPQMYEDGVFNQSQMGMSVYIAPPSKNISLLIGAPGAGTYRSGGLVEYVREIRTPNEARRKRAALSYGQYTMKGIVGERTLSNIEYETYFGYQVAAGYFFRKKQLWHVISSPLAKHMKGSVSIYRIHYETSGNIALEDFSDIDGESFGEYFGAALAVADVTGDGLDDLIIGAPLFSYHGDEGCVYLCTKETSSTLHKKDKKQGLKIGGRFGTTVASLGDIDQDGYDDIAVGAPYENSGVIYIYNGRENGLSSESQQIKASDIHDSIRGFGISIARPTDIDGNKFTDIAVGSYLSEHVVVLRSHPVIDLYGKIKTHEPQFNASENIFIVEACVWYEGSENVPSYIEVIRTLNIDVNFRRFKQVPAKQLTLYYKKYYCENVTIEKEEDYDSSIYGDLDDLTIVISQHLKSRKSNESKILWIDGTPDVEGADKFCLLCPVIRKNHPFQISIPFKQDCGKDGICRSDAQLQCVLTQNGTQLNESNGYVIGTFPNLKLSISVHNLGHTLYNPKVIIIIPQEIELAQIHSSCQDFRGVSLAVSCGVGRIKDGEMKSVDISLDLSTYEILRSMSEIGSHLSLRVSLSNDSYEDTNITNNLCEMKLKLIMVADVNITGKFIGDTVFNKNEVKESNIKHIYEVSNVGVSPIRHVEALFNIPSILYYSVSSLEFSKPMIEVHQNGQSIFCKLTDSYLKSNRYDIKDSSVKFSGKEITFSEKYPSNRTLYLDCFSPNIMCKTWKCNFMELKSTTIAKIIITPKLNFSLLAHVLGQKDIIYFSTYGHVEMIDYNNSIRRPLVETHQDVTVSSPAIGTVSDEIIPLWIIIVCIIAGIILIAAIVFGLAKAGFFKREKKEELQALKSSVN